MSNIAIETKELTKTFNGLTAVDNVSLDIKEGELFGLLGPNGAGKSTLIGMLSTMLVPTSGSARVWGYSIISEATKVRQCIGVVFQESTLDERLTGRENLDLHGRFYGMPNTLRQERMQEVLDLVELSDRADEIVRTYSGGMMRRLEIARGLLHRPKVLFLDEPTLGLDPQTRNRIWEYIKNLNRKEKITMVLTTHYMEEADSLCDRVAIIDRGRIVALGSPSDLKAELGGDIIVLDTPSEDTARGLLVALKSVEGVNELIRCVNSLRITVRDGNHAIPVILEIASKKGFRIDAVNLHKPTLDDVFIHHTGHEMRMLDIDDMDRLRYMMRTRKR